MLAEKSFCQQLKNISIIRAIPQLDSSWKEFFLLDLFQGAASFVFRNTLIQADQCELHM